MNLKEETLSSKEIYHGKILILKEEEVLLPDGKKAKRELVLHPGAVTIIPLISEEQETKICFVRQFRKAVEEVLLELPAGKLEEGEEPLFCAQRELLEETGLEAEELIPLFDFYTSPGFCNELMYLYLAKTKPAEQAKPDDDEFLEVIFLSLKEALQLLNEGKIKDAKTIIGILAAKDYLGEKDDEK